MENLPKRWFINIKGLSEENKKLVGDFYNSHSSVCTNTYSGGFFPVLYSHNRYNVYIGDGNKDTSDTFSEGCGIITDYKEITIEQFKLLVMEMLPEIWYITTTEESNDVVCDWFKSQGHKSFDRSIGNHIGVSSRGVVGYMGIADPKKNFKGGVELTFKQFKKLVLKEQQKTMEQTFTVTREQLKRIHDIACYKWQIKIGGLAGSIGVFEDTLELTYTQVKEMFNAATSAQKPVLKEIFPDFKKDNIAIKNSDIVELGEFSKKLLEDPDAIQTLEEATPKDKPELKNRALWVSENYEVKIGEGHNGWGTYIAFYKK